MSLNTSPDLLLRQTLGVECACKALALLLVPEYSQYSGMEVVVPVPRNAECHCPLMTIGTTGTVPVALVPGKTLLSQIFTAL